MNSYEWVEKRPDNKEPVQVFCVVDGKWNVAVYDDSGYLKWIGGGYRPNPTSLREYSDLLPRWRRIV